MKYGGTVLSFRICEILKNTKVLAVLALISRLAAAVERGRFITVVEIIWRKNRGVTRDR
ncbi:hypothetical protein D3C76_1550150 [compost metagenome]